MIPIRTYDALVINSGSHYELCGHNLCSSEIIKVVRLKPDQPDCDAARIQRD